MQALVRPLVDIAGVGVIRVALAEGNEVPDEPAVGRLGQLEDEAVGGGGGALLAERNVELSASRQMRAVATLGFARPPNECGLSGLDFPAGAFCPRTGNRGGLIALDLLSPLLGAELDRSGRQFLPGLTHAGSIGRSANRSRNLPLALEQLARRT